MKRYSNLFRIPEKLYTQGSPLLIAAGALLKDNQTGNILAQIKFRSLSNKEIKAVKVNIKAFDVSGAEVQGVDGYQYLDLSAARNAEFGQKTAVTLPDSVTRSFSVACTSVIFSDNSAWEAEENAVWEPLPKQQNLENLIGNLAQQYRRDTSIQSHLEPLEYSDLWICSCGAVNRRRESQCCCCGVNRNTIFSALNAESLTQNQSQFEAKEAERRTIQEQEHKKRQAEIKKIAIISSAAAVVVIVFAVLITQVFIPMLQYNSAVQQYNSAVSLMDAGNYEEAITAFEELGDFRDSTELLTEAMYRNANHLFESEKYDDALSIYESLNNYADSNNKILECYFNLGEQYFQKGYYETALEYYKNARQEPLVSRTTEKIYENAIKLYQEDSYNFSLLYFEEVRNYQDSSLYCGFFNILDNDDPLEDIVKKLSEDPYTDFSPAKAILEDNPYHQIVLLKDHQGIYRRTVERGIRNDYFYIKISGYDISILKSSDEYSDETVSSDRWEEEESTQLSDIIDVNDEGIYTVRSKEWYPSWLSDPYKENEYTWQFSFKDGGIKAINENENDYEAELPVMSVETGQYEKIS